VPQAGVKVGWGAQGSAEPVGSDRRGGPAR